MHKLKSPPPWQLENLATSAGGGKIQNDIVVHCQTVANLASFLAGTAKCGDPMMTQKAYTAGLFHDVGKFFIKPHLLKDIDSTEYLEHQERGYLWLMGREWVDDDILNAALQHHERIDGKGLKGQTIIHALTQIVSLADYIVNLQLEDDSERCQELLYSYMTLEAGQAWKKEIAELCLSNIPKVLLISSYSSRVAA